MAPRPFMSIAAAGLEFTASISKSVIERGDTATLHYVLRNPTSQAVTLGFRTGCQILPYIRSETKMVVPHGSGWICTQAFTSLTLAPGQVIDQTRIVFAGNFIQDNLTWDPLAPGKYSAYAELGNPGEDLGRSNVVSFEVK